MFRYDLVVKNVFDRAVVFLFVSHENDVYVLILSGLSCRLLSGFVFSHLWSFNFKLGLKFFRICCWFANLWNDIFGLAGNHCSPRKESPLAASTKLSPVLRGSLLAAWPDWNTPCCYDFFAPFLSLLFAQVKSVIAGFLVVFKFLVFVYW